MVGGSVIGRLAAAASTHARHKGSSVACDTCGLDREELDLGMAVALRVREFGQAACLGPQGAGSQLRDVL
jgi:hypothetical protein